MCLKTGQKRLSDLRKGGSERCSTGDLLQGWERTTAFVWFVNIFVTTVIIQIFKKNRVEEHLSAGSKRAPRRP
jgi:hypothetical protein